MSDSTGKLGCTLWSFAVGGMAGALATVMLVFFGGLSWPGAVWTGAVLAVALGIFLSAVLCRPLPTMAAVQARAAAHAPAATPAPAVTPASTPAAAPVVAPAQTGPTKPEFMTAARDGGPDDLKQIKGVGPKLEQLLHSMGVYHFDQIAAWTAHEVAWVDDNLEGFKGRVTRDDWVAQARLLAAGGQTEHSAAVARGEAT